MKKTFALLTALLLLLCSALALAEDDPLCEEAVAIGAAMRRLAASSDYIAAMGAGSGEILELCSGMGVGDVRPSRVLCFTFDRAEDMRRLREESNDLAARLPDDQLSILLDRLVAAIPSQLNAYVGVKAIAATSLLTYGKTIAVPDLACCRLYVLEYAVGMPVMVTVFPGEGAAALSGTFLLNTDWESILPELLPVRPLPVE